MDFLLFHAEIPLQMVDFPAGYVRLPEGIQPFCWETSVEKTRWFVSSVSGTKIQQLFPLFKIVRGEFCVCGEFYSC